MLTVEFGESTMTRTQVQLWYNRFKEGQENVNENARPGRPSTLTTDENIEAVKEMILNNCWITIGKIADDVCISFGLCQAIFTDVLAIKRAAANIVSKLLYLKQKQRCMDINDHPDLIKKVITGGEPWVYGYDIETKAQSFQWKLIEELRLKKAHQVRSNVKVLRTVVFDCNGRVHHEFLPQGRTINKEYYFEVMRRWREA